MRKRMKTISGAMAALVALALGGSALASATQQTASSAKHPSVTIGRLRGRAEEHRARWAQEYGIGISTVIRSGPEGNAVAWTVNTRYLRPW
jgi:hypothetical protein